MTDINTPSLLEPESRGGDNAARGFDFQDHFLVSQIPRWLALDGFFSVLHEAVSDIEVQLYSPGYGETIEMIEAKNYRLTPSVFWGEIDRFYAVDQGSPNTFHWFRIVVPDISDEIAPLQNGLRRLRSPYGFYPKDSNLLNNSFADFTRLVLAANKPSAYANFLFHRVLIDTGYSMAQEHGEALFRQNVGECLPEYLHLPYSVITMIYRALLPLVSQRNTPIHRRTLEDAMRSSIPDEHLPPPAPVRLYTLHQDDDEERKDLVVDWRTFFGGTTRMYPEPEVWNSGVVDQLTEIKKFILAHRNTRQLKVTGSRRLSSTLALGAVFSATSGFSISLEHREGMWWHTNHHAGTEDNVPLVIEHPRRQGEQLIVSLGIPQNIRPSVENYARDQDAENLPLLNIYFAQPVENARQANAIVAQVKASIREALTQTHATQIHLFCAVPSFIALLIGHRLNATAVVQCYEFIGADNYVPTCLIST